MPHYRRSKIGTRLVNSSNSTAGKNKCASCQADPLTRAMAYRSRSYKDPRYEGFCDKGDRYNK